MPPAASIAALAPAVAPMPLSATLRVSSPVLMTLTVLTSSRTRPACFSVSRSTSSVPRRCKLAERDLGVVLQQRRLEAALGQAALQRHLAAFEADLVVAAGARLLALVATAGGLAQARADAAADAAARLLAAGGRLDGVELHVCPVLDVRCAQSTCTRYETLLIMPRTAGVSSQLAHAVELAQAEAAHRGAVRLLAADRAATSLTLTVFLSAMIVLSSRAVSRRSLRPSCRAWPPSRPAWSSASARRAWRAPCCTGWSSRGSWPRCRSRPSLRTPRASGRRR